MATRKRTAKPANNNGSPDPETELRTAAGYGSNNPKLDDLQAIRKNPPVNC